MSEDDLLELGRQYHNIVLQGDGFKRLDNKLDDWDEYVQYKKGDVLYEVRDVGRGFVEITGIYKNMGKDEK